MQKKKTQFAIVITTTSFIASSVFQLDFEYFPGFALTLGNLPCSCSLVKHNGSLERHTDGDGEGEEKHGVYTRSVKSDEDDLY